ncbi:type IV pilin protein [Mangrovitalea sediminis]|uniref:type IV pilin protein n=1 Tax=Mangrovitalea sediminis TaxID=1982043 RepID=UPI000BE54388|nr:type IV pilin protein [Mangrovitalea sediminis]
MRRGSRHQKGFTLIELMIVVVIIGILTAIALPLYEKQVQESRRTSAKTTLLDIASKEEKFYATNNAYTSSLANLGYASVSTTCTGGASTCLEVPSANEAFYAVSVVLNNGGTGFTADAVPENAQKNDDCGTFEINDQGAQSVTGTATDCW